MKKIGIDLDKTLFNCESLLYDLLNKFQFINKNDKTFIEIDINNIKEISPFIKKINKILNPSFYTAYPYAIQTINSLHEAGYKIYFISSRPNINFITSATVEWLINNKVHCDKLIMACNNKAHYAYENKLDFFIDDLVDNCMTLEKIGIKSILFDGCLKNKDYFKLKKTDMKFTVLNCWSKIGEFIKEYNLTETQIEEKLENDIKEDKDKIKMF